jgi:hypothetical protein
MPAISGLETVRDQGKLLVECPICRFEARQISPGAAREPQFAKPLRGDRQAVLIAMLDTAARAEVEFRAAVIFSPRRMDIAISTNPVAEAFRIDHRFTV